MKKKPDDEMTLDGITVKFGQTTLRELIQAGYSVGEGIFGENDWDDGTTMLPLLRAGKHIGDVVLFGPLDVTVGRRPLKQKGRMAFESVDVTSNGLLDHPIGLILI